VETETWKQLDPTERYRAVCVAFALSRPAPPVLSHWSALVLHGLGIIGRWPTAVHVSIERSSGGRSRSGMRTHATRLHDADVVSIDGILVTSIERTVVDLMAVESMHGAVAIADAALRIDRFGRRPPRTNMDRVIEVLNRALPFPGSVRASAAIDFATTLADSVNESASRVTVAMIGAPPPILQFPFHLPEGDFEVDFYWERQSAVGEADGRSKYLNGELRGDRSIEEVVMAEKRREDGIRRVVRHFGRWDFRTGLSTSLLRPRLIELGVPLGLPRLQPAPNAAVSSQRTPRNSGGATKT
jgi:hypothetical protein